jgi:hypothetical protein
VRGTSCGVLPKDEHGNAHLGDVLHTGNHNNLVHATSRLVSLVAEMVATDLQAAKQHALLKANRFAVSWPVHGRAAGPAQRSRCH